MRVLYTEIDNNSIFTIVENPCYHCYRGAVGECVGCKHDSEIVDKDFESSVIVFENSFISVDDPNYNL